MFVKHSKKKFYAKKTVGDRSHIQEEISRLRLPVDRINCDAVIHLSLRSTEEHG